MPFIQEVSGFGVAVPEMECNRVVEDCGAFNLCIHRSLVELVKAEDVSHQPLHGLVPDAGVVALIRGPVQYQDRVGVPSLRFPDWQR